jgi:hypothetical protein
LCDTDEQEENDLLQIVFSLLRVGEYSKVNSRFFLKKSNRFLCLDFRQKIYVNPPVIIG